MNEILDMMIKMQELQNQSTITIAAMFKVIEDLETRIKKLEEAK